MKKVLLLAALLGTTALGGCAGMTPASVTAEVSALETEVKADADLVCGFIPTAATIASFIPGVGTIAVGASSIAESICDAIKTAPPVVVQSARLRSLRYGGQRGAAVNVATVYVPSLGQNVPISGKFTR